MRCVQHCSERTEETCDLRKKAHNLARVRDKKISLFEDPEQIPNNRLYCIKNLIYRLDKHTTNSIFKVVTHFCWELRISGKISIDFPHCPFHQKP